jgi:HlyD family secretion protein
MTKSHSDSRRFPGSARLATTAALLIGILCSATVCGNRQKAGAGSSSASGVPAATPLVHPQRVIGLGRIEPEGKILDLAGEVQGLISRIGARPGDRAAKGDPIIELTRAVEEARIGQAEAGLRTHTSDLESARAALAVSKIRARSASLAYYRALKLVAENAQAQVILDNAKADFESLSEDVRRFEAAVRSAETLLDQDRADLKLARAELDRRFIRAPEAGQVLSLDVTAGSLVAPGTPLGKFAADAPLTAWCEIDELFADEVKEGQAAVIRRQGTMEEIGRGSVVFAGPYLRKKSLFSDEVGELDDRRVREVRIRLEPGSRVLYGARVECVIQTGKDAK